MSSGSRANSGHRKVLSALLLTTACAAPALAQAQQAVAPSQLQEVVVTAQRRTENLQVVPITVTAVNAATLARSAVTNTQELSILVPGLTFPSTQGVALPHLRGIGITAVEAGVENSVALYVDGIYYATAAGSVLTLNNISDIQVLKGPQGTLFGRNTTGGVIQVTTKDPSSTFGGNGSVSYGNYEKAMVDGYVTGAVAANLAADLAVHLAGQGEGYGKNLTTGKDTYKQVRDLSVRSKFVWTPMVGTKVRLSVDYENNVNVTPLQPLRGHEGEVAFYDGAVNGSVSNFTQPFGAGLIFNPSPSLLVSSGYDIRQDTDATKIVKSGGVALLVEHDLGFARIVNNAAYRKQSYYSSLDADLGPRFLQTVLTDQRDTQFSDELQLQSSQPGRLKWSAGLYYFYGDDLYPNTVNFNNTGRVPYVNFPRGCVAPSPFSCFQASAVQSGTQITNAIAVYAEGAYEILPKTNLTLGARYTYESKKMTGYETAIWARGVAAPPCDGCTVTTNYGASTDITKPSWRVSLDHKFTDDIMAYVSWNQSFKNGGYNLSSPRLPGFLPETLSAYEVGIKTASFDRRLRLNASAFYYDYSNVQVVQFVNGSPLVYNGGTAEIYGLDVDMEAALTEHLRITAGFEALHNEFTSLPCAQFYILPAGVQTAPPYTRTCAASALLNFPGTVVLQSANGNKLPATPDFSGSLSADYTTGLFGGKAEFGIRYSYNSGYYSDPNNQLKQKAFDVVNASARWAPQDDAYYVQVWGKNIADTRYTYQLATSARSFAQSFAPPVTYGVTIGAKF